MAVRVGFLLCREREKTFMKSSWNVKFIVVFSTHKKVLEVLWSYARTAIPFIWQIIDLHCSIFFVQPKCRKSVTFGSIYHFKSINVHLNLLHLYSRARSFGSRVAKANAFEFEFECTSMCRFINIQHVSFQFSWFDLICMAT